MADEDVMDVVVVAALVVEKLYDEVADWDGREAADGLPAVMTSSEV